MQNSSVIYYHLIDLDSFVVCFQPDCLKTNSVSKYLQIKVSTEALRAE